MIPFKCGALSMALTAAMSANAYADNNSTDTSKDGFVEGSGFNLDLKNYYFNHDRHDGKQDSKEWGQGFIGVFESGFTHGPVGFGIDANAMLGLKLDGGGGSGGTSILPTTAPNPNKDNLYGDAPDSFSSAGGALKMRAFDTVLKVGDLFLNNPVIAGGATRLLPMTFRGFSLTNTSVDHLKLDAGQVSFDKLFNQSGDGRIGTYYGTLPDNRQSKHMDWAGATYTAIPGLTSSLYASQLKDIWNQAYYDLDYTWVLNSLVSINPGFHYYHTQDSGQALLGNIDNNTYSLHLGVTVGNQTLTTSMQKVNGNTPFDYIQDGDSIFLDNSQQYSDFNAPGEKSWKLQYGYDFVGWGAPGLTSAVSYTRGTMDLTKATTASDSGYSSYYNADGSDAKHWERDVDLKYVVQSGKAKNLGVRLRWATDRGGDGYQTVDHNIDEYRVIVDYPINVF
ncbi:OprD family porin [Pseudomonas sp.]|uniref:OprD family porin n=1 Tax=Pseudomonas sp. TaxID=306 RepID=UPI00260D92F7|nr:OprD family porin [Pseudomonas sp.]